MRAQFWFKSDLFAINKDEDDEVNPGCYGKELAKWISKELDNHDYKEIQFFAEDWGWCVSCKYQDTYLYANCGNISSEETSNAAGDLVWTIFSDVKVSFFKKLFGKVDPEENLRCFNNTLEAILKNQNRIELFSSEPE